MKLIRRWALMIALNLLNVAVFTLNDWEFYVIAILIGIGVGNLFSNEE
jgi:hypothetical protein